MNKGKPFEHKISHWLKELEIYHERFLDARSVGGFTAQRPADYFVYYNKQLYYLELKSSQNFRLSFSRLTQMKKLIEIETYGIISYFIISFNGEIYAILTNRLKIHCENVISRRHSLSMTDASEIGIRIHNKEDLRLIF